MLISGNLGVGNIGLDSKRLMQSTTDLYFEHKLVIIKSSYLNHTTTHSVTLKDRRITNWSQLCG